MNILDTIQEELSSMRKQMDLLVKLVQKPTQAPHERIGMAEACRMLKRSPDVVRDGVRNGRYPGYRDGTGRNARFYFFRDELQAYLETKPATVASLAAKARSGQRA